MEGAEKLLLRVVGEVTFREPSGQLNCSLHLGHIGAAPVAGAEMRLEARPLRRWHRPLDVFRDHLDEFLAIQFIRDRHR